MKVYNFIFSDGQYMTFELTESEFKGITVALCANPIPAFVSFSSGAVSTDGLRYVKEWVEPEPEVPVDSAVPPEYAMDEKLYNKLLTEAGEFEDDGRPV